MVKNGARMKKVTSYENYRVVIYPRSLGDFGSVSMSDFSVTTDEADRQAQYRERCHQIATDVGRHISNVGIVSVEFDTMAVCTYCGAAWTEASDQYNGGCCDQDEEGNPERDERPFS